MRCLKWITGSVMLVIMAPALAVAPAEVITYQGQLKQDGVPFTGFADLKFTLWDHLTNSVANPPIEDRLNVEVVNGLFNVELDFPASLYSQPRWIGVQVRTPAGSANAFETLTPRQPVTGAPYALYALNVLGGGGGGGGTLDQAYDFGGPGAGRTITADSGAVSITGAGGLSVSGGITSGPVKLNLDSNDFDVQVSRGPTLLVGDPSNVTVGGKFVTGTPASPVPHWAYLTVGTSVHRITRDSGADLRFTIESAPNAQAVTDQMTLTEDGDLGIGTSVPAARLHVNDSTDIASGGTLVLGSTSSANLVFDNNEIAARNNGAPASLILSREGGSVGVGVTPSNSIRLHVQVPSTDSDMALYAATYGSGRAGLFESHQSNTTHTVSIFKNDGPALRVSGNVLATDAATDAPLSVIGGSDSTPSGGGFAVLGSTTGANVSIDSNEIMARNNGSTATLALNASGGNVNLIQGGTGNVGIGTSSPGHRLDVAGRMRVREGGGDAGMWLYQSTPAADRAFVGMFGDNTVGLYGNNGAGWGLAMSTSTGNVGVGTTVPKSKLHVNGDYYGRGHLYLYALEGDGASGTAYVQARDDSTTSNIDLRLRSKAGTTAVDVLTCKSNGRVGIGTTAPASLLDVAGTARVNVLVIDGGADFSENFDVGSQSDGLDVDIAEPGTVVAIDPENPGKLRIATSAYDATVAGIISGAGGVGTGMVMAHEGTVADGKHPVALTGRVYCKVDASHGAIKPGDLLTTSDTPGHAMKVMDRERAAGAVLGKAMTSLPQGERGLVLVLVSLQ
jgi:hypothetical protein